MASSKTLTVNITGDASNARRALRMVGDDVDQLDGKAGRAAGGWGSAMGLIGSASAAAASAAAAGVAGFGILSARGVQNAADLGESINAIEVSLGAGADSFLAFGEDSANSLGITQAALNQAVTPIAAIFSNAGSAGDELSGKLQTLATRATDVGSVFNTDTTAVIEAFGASLRGEQEPIRQFGVSLDDAAIRAKAVEMGLADTTAAVDQAGKVQATYALIMEQTDKAAGDFQNTADSLPNTLKRVQASAEESLGALGGPLLAPLADGADMLADALAPLEPVLERVGGTMGDILEPVMTLASGFIDGLLPAIDAASQFIDELVEAIGPELEEWARENGDAFAEMGQSVADLISATEPLIPVLAEALGFFLDFASAGLQGAATVTNLAERATEASAALGVFGGALGAMSSGQEGAAESGGAFADMVDEAAASAEAAQGPTVGQALAMDNVASAADTATAAVDEWNATLQEVFGGTLDVFGATTKWEADIDKLTETLMINGATLDANTAKGRANRDQLEASAKSALDVASAYANTGDIEAANFVLATTRERLIESGVAAGQSRDQMELYLDALGLTPENINTAIGVETPNLPAVEEDIDHAARDRDSTITAEEEGSTDVDRVLTWAARSRPARALAWADTAEAEADLTYLARDRKARIGIETFMANSGGYASADAADRPDPNKAGRRSTADLFPQRPVNIWLDGEKVGRSQSVYNGVKQQAHRDRSRAGRAA